MLILAIGTLVFACNDKFMDRYPETQMSGEAFFNSESDLKQYCNSFYSPILPGANIYTDDNNSDNVDMSTLSEEMTGTRTVPSTSGAWGWGDLRNINYFLEHYNKAAISDTLKNHYAGVARFFRAFFYFNKLKTFGAVPWYSSTLGTTSDDLYKARDPRNVVVDSIVADLDFAIRWVSRTHTNTYITRWAALVLKSRICLYEGTWEKYHSEDAFGVSGSDGSNYLRLAADAAYEVMINGGYSLYNTGKPTQDYGDLFAMESADLGEVILAREYVTGLAAHNSNAQFISATLGNPGLTKDLIESYLTKDGLPFSLVSNYNVLEFPQETANRDPRLAQTIRTPGYKRRGGTTLQIPDFKSTLTGYQCVKFVTEAENDGNMASTNDLPIFRLAEVMLNYAEAKAELGNFSAADAAISLNPIRKRAGMPDFDINVASDPLLISQYDKNHDPLILAIRRERRVELAIEGFRKDDLMRWGEGQSLSKSFRGMYFSEFGNKDFNGDGMVDFGIYADPTKVSGPVSTIQYLYLASSPAVAPSYVLSQSDHGTLNIHPYQSRAFYESRDYLDPMPTNEILLNPKLTQNPGWEDGN